MRVNEILEVSANFEDTSLTAVYTERYTDDDIYRPIPVYIPANYDENKNTDSHETLTE